MKKYLITPSLLNSWKYCIESGNLDNFLQTLNREEIQDREPLIKGNDFELYMVQNYPDTKNGCYQVKVYKEILINGIRYLIYGKLDCLKAGKITDYKYTGNYEVGKFYGSYQTAIYMELVQEAYEIEYLISNNFNKDNVIGIWEEDKKQFNLFKETYKRSELEINLEEEIRAFIKWLERLDLLKIYQEKW